MKSMSIDTIANFPFPTAPDRPSLQKSEKVSLSIFIDTCWPNIGTDPSIASAIPRGTRSERSPDRTGKNHECFPIATTSL